MIYQNYTCRRQSETLNINLLPFDRDERAVYVDSVLDVLCESRFGPGHIFDPYDLRCSDIPPAFVNYDLMPVSSGRASGSFPLESVGSNGSESRFAVDRPDHPASAQNMSAFSPLNRSPSTLARGSSDDQMPYNTTVTQPLNLDL